MFEDYLGIIMPWAGTYAPKNWLECMGQTLAIADYRELFDVVNTIYGGDGKTYFRLPDLRGRVLVAAGQSAAHSNYALGQYGGHEQVMLASTQIVSHRHEKNTYTPLLTCSQEQGTLSTPVDNYPAVTPDDLYSGNSTGSNLVAATAKTAPSSKEQTPMPTISPYCAVQYIICVKGVNPYA